MATVGQILREARESKLLKLEDIEKHTKIRKELLESLESDDYSKLPPATFVQGFIKNYSKYLGLETDKLLALFRRDYEAKKHPPIILKSFTKPMGSKGLQITPPRVFGIVIGLVVFGFFAYLWTEYRQYVGAPPLEIASPKDQQTVEIPSVLVEGKSDPEAKVAINNQEVGLDKEGKFQEEVKLSSSTNTITVTATGKFGQASKIERTVFVRK